MKRLAKSRRTERGFEIVNFNDRYQSPCSLQQSSIATEDCVWLGVDDAAPKIMASQAHMLGVQTSETSGWVAYPMPQEVQLNTRMHLDRKQVAALVTHLQAWLESGSFEVK